MNKKALEIGMKEANFKNPSGLASRGQLSTSYDLTILTLHSSFNFIISKILTEKQYHFHIKGPQSRDIMIKTTVRNDFLNNFYTVIGGKTGTLGYIKNLSVLIFEDNQLYVVTALGATGNRFHQVRLILDQALGKPINEPIQVKSYNVIKYPTIPEHLLKHVHLNSLLAKDDDVKSAPASLTKLLTLLTALDYPLPLNQEVEILNCDIVEDGLNPLHVGDILTIEDILHLMLLSSSNIAANMLARFVEETYLR
ncbi:D-alanyl-D-alanine endopeptidase [Staphylococcus microti]|uniref:D-alanyl-D-alanine endopeptidase n=2 Tax=Staphylococcus microti TaxID=569857 RepID=A0A380GXW0_9STAP|nr:serine hydrolase [Staphylococcus microti]PNZ84481.1 hypothetical protein CD132_00620 [Staphylococcus microti]SUM58317.1 D-alanyl-D-alanine endopeptidase [Staphylococcus microti]